MDLYEKSTHLLRDPKQTRWLSPLLLAADACLCALIIYKVPYTEIDWKAYMEQVSQYLDGERDYTLIKGGTGPLVYPAAHVYIYSGLRWVTNGGENIMLAQIIFGGLYLSTLALVMACYRAAKAPPYIFPLLILSKRLHSLFVLRLFNDCFAVGALFLAIYAYQKRLWTIGSIVYSLGVGIKMSLLLAAPAVGIILCQALPLRGRAISAAFIMAQVQYILAFPFLRANLVGYLSRAFELSRQFLFKWTVNWRFLGEKTFRSRELAYGLLVCHLSQLLLFIGYRWTRPSGLSTLAIAKTIFDPLSLQAHRQISSRIVPSFVLTSILSSMILGLLFARTLHYQFYAYIAWSSPFLLWRSGLHPVLIYLVWAAQEWAWNAYPSTNISSMVVVGCLALQVLGVWWGTKDDFADMKTDAADSKCGPLIAPSIAQGHQAAATEPT